MAERLLWRTGSWIAMLFVVLAALASFMFAMDLLLVLLGWGAPGDRASPEHVAMPPHVSLLGLVVAGSLVVGLAWLSRHAARAADRAVGRP
jgi:hypothetical protein